MKIVLALAAASLLATGTNIVAQAATTTSPAVLRVADNDEQTYIVVKNHEGQYSIWPEGRDLALGWEEAGFSGSKAECLAWIRQHR